MYRLIVPDLRGFGQSSTPTDVASYGGKNVTSDLAALLGTLYSLETEFESLEMLTWIWNRVDALSIEKAVFIGHDWGGAMVWRMCLYHPSRVLAVAGICTPYTPPHKQYVDMDTVIKFIPAFEYQKFLANTADAASYLETSPRRFFSALFRRFNETPPKAERPAMFSDTLRGVKDSPHALYSSPSTLLSKEEMEYYVQQYTHSGFQSNCNYYATRKLDFDTELGLPITLPMPALYIGADKDAILSPAMARKMPQFIPQLEMKVVKNAGHWVLWEQTEQVNAILHEWLAKIDARFGPQATHSARL
jgi:soluble epoxide hydrolase/lipid-phosphate phosphatase